MIKTLDLKVLMTDGSDAVTPRDINPDSACAFLEHGGVIFFPESPFKFSKEHTQFLLSRKQKEADYHKNISYRPKENRMTGIDNPGSEEGELLRTIMADFHKQVYDFMRTFLAPYAKNWKPDFASFRPIEEKGRKMRLRARNDLLHVDSFPTRPIYGDRILRTFININPVQSRVWNTSDTFETLAHRFGGAMAAPKSLNAVPTEPSALQRVMKKFGLKGNSRSPYDAWMLDFHNFLKENQNFQATCRRDRWEFPPNSSWIVFTDMASHAVLEGQFALEQTTIVSQKDLVCPEKAPINILRRLYRLP